MNMINKDRSEWNRASADRMAQLHPPRPEPRLRIRDVLLAAVAVGLGAAMVVALLVLAFTPEVL